ncbi:MAG: adenylate/guanylate cyclase domain-containing protein [Candidatus Binataceae bacterium]
MRCESCSTENPQEARFCIQCATPFKRRCQKCAFENPAEARFCAQCATALNREAGQSSKASSNSTRSGIRIAAENSEAPAIDGERKTVTALFADIKGSTELEQNLDPEDARAIIDPALELMIGAVHRYDGYVAQSTGDGIFAMFGAPLAHEDHPQRALYAGLRMQEELLRYGTKLQAEGRAPIEIRVGVNTGEVVVRSIATGNGQVEFMPIGHTTNLASRLQTLARTGTVAISEQTRKLVEGYFQLKSLGPTTVKGVSEPVNLYEVTGLGPLRTRLQRSAGRGLSKFVGREAEMESLKRAAEQAHAGHGQIVAAMAEAGMGKSRLLFEFKAVSQSGWKVLEAFSISHGKAFAFLPVIDLLRSYFKFSSDDDQRSRREKINGKVLTLDRSLEDTLPYLYGLLGLTEENNQIAEIEAQTRKRRALDAIKRILLRESLNQPLIVIFEDLHWIDNESQAFLDLLVDCIGTARILLLVNYRPEYCHQWSHKTYYTQLRLDPLGKEHADNMLRALLGNGAEVGPLKRLIIEKTEGNPFFMEETVQVLLDEGALVRDGSIKLTKPLRELKIPPTVQAILAARIDRLPRDQKDLLQTLAVIGMEFKLGLVRTVWQRSSLRGTAPPALSRQDAAEGETELESMLSELQLGEFIYEQPAVGDIEYTFKHALTHDVAYNSVLNERRRPLHERIGTALESTYSDNLRDHVADLAHHFARGGNPGKAAEYCLRAVSQFADLGSNSEALAQFESGLEQLQKLPDDDRRAELELDLRIAASGALGDSKGFGSLEVEQSAARAMELCQRPDINWERSWAALFEIFFVQQFRPDVRKAEAIAVELVARAEEHDSVGRLAESANWLAYARMVSGDFELAAQAFERAWTLLETITKPATNLAQRCGQMAQTQALIKLMGTQQNNRILSGWNLWFLGYPDRAQGQMRIATAIAESGTKTILADVHGFASYICELRREPEQMRARAEARRVIATESGYFSGRALSEIYLGWADAMAGDLDGGIARMRDHMSELKSAGSEYISDRGVAFIATALGKMRRFDEALCMIDESFKFIERTGQHYYEAELHRLKGELSLAQDAANAAQAEESFRTGIEVACKQHAKSWELRATTSLARLLAKQGERDEARAMLLEIYNWFTEGFGTADLNDAKALLEEFRG